MRNVPTERATNENFDERSYLIVNPDVADAVASGGDARLHFLTFGQGEGRRQAKLAGIPEIVFIQTCDSFKYVEMLYATSRTVIEFCRRNGYHYEMHMGNKRGCWGWHSAYNRIILLKEKIDQGFSGWVVYMDADAYIWGMDFDLDGFLAERSTYGAVFERADPDWSVNDGVTMVNLGHPQGRRLVMRWYDAFMALSDDWLRQNWTWSAGYNDQDLLQTILQDDRAISDAVVRDRTDCVNSTTSRFIRQSLRAQFDTFQDRLAFLQHATRAILDASPRRVSWDERR